MPDQFHLVTSFTPAGDQPQAIRKLLAGVRAGHPHQVLLGVTGSGKTFTIANVVAQLNLPTLVLAPNKTLAAQLYGEFQEFFPDNAVEYFVSYYDYYQPEAYVPQADLYIEKDSSINEAIDRMRHSATRSLFDRQDVIIVASVSCIYGLGSPEAYHGMLLSLEEGAVMDRREVLKQAGGDFVRAQRHRFSPGHLPGAGRPGGDLPGLRRGPGHPGGFLGRHGGGHPGDRPPPGPDAAAAQTRHDLPRLPLRHPGPGAPPGHGRHRGGVGPAAGLVPGTTANCWRPSAWRSAPASTWR